MDGINDETTFNRDSSELVKASQLLTVRKAPLAF